MTAGPEGNSPEALPEVIVESMCKSHETSFSYLSGLVIPWSSGIEYDLQ
jgi:hypothetical protein